jgi:hypothetical protein
MLKCASLNFTMFYTEQVANYLSAFGELSHQIYLEKLR